MNAGKTAVRRSAKKKAPASKRAGSDQDSAKRPSAEEAARTEKSTAPVLQKEGRSGAPASGKTSRRSKVERPARRAASSTETKGKHTCQSCSSGCMLEDPIEVAKRMMKGSVPAIVKAMVEQAKQGSCPHAKTLLEMTGARFMFDEQEMREAGESWAKLVLERMDQAEREKARGVNG